MRRSLLRDLLRDLLLASLPIAQGACIFGGCPVHGDYTVAIDGGLPDGPLTDADCVRLCVGESSLSTVQACEPGITDGGTPGLTCHTSTPCLGRRPPRLRPGCPAGPGAGDWFAAAAHLEAASIRAFRLLQRELVAHGAPARLIAGARLAAVEEARHARAMARLARRSGAVVPRVEVAPTAIRELEEIAVENAVEGCVGETWGALVAAWQASAAHDRRVRAVMSRIAPDEAGHAELAWQVHAWADKRLPSAARRRVRAARHDAMAGLASEAGREASAEVVRVTGWPCARAMVQLMRAATPLLQHGPRPRA